MNAKHATRVRGRKTPDPVTEYLLYQTIVGIWPFEVTSPGLRELTERVRLFMEKAIREAKLRTSWTNPDPEYEEATAHFVNTILGADASDPWRRDVAQFVDRIARPGLWNSLSRVLVHLTAPGTPDLYQGDELWNFALVDPDNRRPVDFDLRTRLLDELERDLLPSGYFPEPLLRERLELPEDGRVKLYVTVRLMRTRRAHAELFSGSGYERLHPTGAHAQHVFAFARTGPGGPAVAIACRWPLTLTGGTAPPTGSQIWGDTAVSVPGEWPRRWDCAISGRAIEARDGTISIGETLDPMPVALLLPAD